MSAGPPALTGVYTGAVLLLGAAGAAKVHRPGDTATALRGIGLRTGPVAVRLAAAAEVALAVAALAVGGPVPAALVAASYAGFAAFVAVALARHLPLATCGCFGRPDTPPSWTHVVLDAAAALVAAAWAATTGLPAAAATFRHAGARTTALALGGLVVAGLAAALLTDPLARARTPRRTP